MIRKLLQLALLLLLSLPALATSYYVDCDATDANGDGTTTSTAAGAHEAFKTVAQVNAATFAAGDSLLFNKGCTWREQLNVP